MAIKQNIGFQQTVFQMSPRRNGFSSESHTSTRSLQKQFHWPPALRRLIAKTCSTSDCLHESDVAMFAVHVALNVSTESFVKATQLARLRKIIICVTFDCHSQQLDVKA